MSCVAGGCTLPVNRVGLSKVVHRLMALQGPIVLAGNEDMSEKMDIEVTMNLIGGTAVQLMPFKQLPCCIISCLG